MGISLVLAPTSYLAQDRAMSMIQGGEQVAAAIAAVA
jgi:hypothetical protein